MAQPGILTAEDLSCLVIPDGCVGIPTLAALEQGIPVIAVKGNRNLMRNDLRMLPWAEGQLHFAENYLEAHGIMGALKAGLSIGSLVRPMKATKVVRRQQSDSAVAGKPDKSGTSQS